MTSIFKTSELKKLYIPNKNSSGEDNGSVTIIGGSKLFHGAPILSLKVASRLVDMVFFATPEKPVGYVAEQIKSKLMSFVWVPWADTEAYIAKSDAILIGPGFMRFGSEKIPENKRGDMSDGEGKVTRDITERLLKTHPTKRWVIDAGSLQVMDVGWIPKGAIITPNQKEFSFLFGIKNDELSIMDGKAKTHIVSSMAAKHKCTIVLKGPETIVASPSETVVVKGGNAGMTKGGTGDILAGLTVSLLAKNEPLLAASAASFIEKKAADELYNEVRIGYNADDLADRIPSTFKKLTG